MTDKQNDTEEQINIWADDKGDRKPVADDFTKIITQKETPFVMSLDAGFGFGKTFFVKHWRDQLIEDGHTAFYFNAWQSDYTGEPLVAFAMEFQKFLTEEELICESAGEFEGAVGDVVSGILKASVKQFSYGIIDIEAQKEKLDESKMEKMAEGMAVSKIEAHLEIKESVKRLKKNITKICQEIEKNKGAKALPIYVMVDELDRCRPSFAIEFLEIIKHFFDVKKLMFIVATDQNQLQHSVKSVYGEGYDGQGYLRRFFDLELSLPTMPKKAYIDALCTKHGLKKLYNENSKDSLHGLGSFIGLYALYADFFDLSLRDIERGMVLTEIALALMPGAKIFFFPMLFSFLLAARQRDMKFYNQIGTSLKTFEAILDEAETLAERQGYFDDPNLGGGHNLKPWLLMAIEDYDAIAKEYARLNKEQLEMPSSPERNEIMAQQEIYERAMGMYKHVFKSAFSFDSKGILLNLKEKIDVVFRYTE